MKTAYEVYSANVFFFRILTDVWNFFMDGQSEDSPEASSRYVWFTVWLMLNGGDEVKCWSWNVIQHKCQDLQEIFFFIVWDRDIMDHAVYITQRCLLYLSLQRMLWIGLCTIQVKEFLFLFLCLQSFPQPPILLVESSGVKCNSIRWLLPRGLWCSFSSCCFSSPSPPLFLMQWWEVDHAILLLLHMSTKQ